LCIESFKKAWRGDLHAVTGDNRDSKKSVLDDLNDLKNNIPFAIPEMRQDSLLLGKDINIHKSEQYEWEDGAKNEIQEQFNKDPEKIQSMKTLCNNNPIVKRKNMYNQGDYFKLSGSGSFIVGIGGWYILEKEGKELHDAQKEYVKQILDNEIKEYQGFRNIVLPISLLLDMWFMPGMDKKVFDDHLTDLAECCSTTLYFTKRQVGIKGGRSEERAGDDDEKTIKFIKNKLNKPLKRIQKMLKNAREEGLNMANFWKSIFISIISTEKCVWKNGAPLHMHRLIRNLIREEKEAHIWKLALDSSIKILIGSPVNPNNKTRAFNLNKMNNEGVVEGGYSVYKEGEETENMIPIL
jgi:hypothetical protein